MEKRTGISEIMYKLDQATWRDRLENTRHSTYVSRRVIATKPYGPLPAITELELECGHFSHMDRVPEANTWVFCLRCGQGSTLVEKG